MKLETERRLRALDADKVSGPASSTDGNLAVFDGTTGKLVADGGLPFRKNAIINGDFQVWQDGTSFAAMANGQYISDNGRYNKTGAMVHTGSQSADVPTVAEAGRKILYSLLIDCTTIDSSIAAGDFATFSTFVEGYNFVNIAGVGLCHQFWHKHTKIGTYCVSYRNSGADRSFVREYTQAVSDTWELATVLIDASPTAGTWDYTNGVGLQVIFTIAAGSTFQTTAGAWQTGNYLATSNQVNACDSTSNNFMLAGVQLEKGSVATEFDVQTFDEELTACQRYYEKTFQYSVAPAQATGSYLGAVAAIASGAVSFDGNFNFKVRKRTTPTITTYNPTQSNANWRTGSDTADVALTVSANLGEATVQFTGVSAGLAAYYVHAVANARF